MNMKNCRQCQTKFEITDQDRAFYERISPVVKGKKFSIPEPSFCPSCRQQRRLSFENQLNLSKRKCSKTGKEMISCYSADTPFPVYSLDEYISNQFDPTVYGRDYDFNRPFFDQFRDLLQVVPRPTLIRGHSFDENSDYTNYSGKNKNCYMIFDSDYNRDCCFSYSVNNSKDCMDVYRVKQSELCYESVDCTNCYRLFFSQDCENCSESAYLKNCIGVKNSFMCSNLKNKEFYIFNQPFPKEKYEELMKSLGSHDNLGRYQNDWKKFKIQFPQRFMHGVQSEQVSGDYLISSKNSEYCFDSMQLWDCKYHTRSFGSAKDCMDCDEVGDGVELMYETIVAGYEGMNVLFSFIALPNCHDIFYCMFSELVGNSFGCVSLNKKNYCILNKQYSKEDYEALLPKILEHLQKTGEWGEFFPMNLSDFAYNETLAQQHFPVTKQQAVALGSRWKEDSTKEFLPATAEISQNVESAPEDITKKLFVCQDCKKNYKIIDQEYRFHKTQRLALPKSCFFCRNKERASLRNPRKLFDRVCDQCQTALKTTYSPEWPEKIFCETCYQNSLA